VAALSREALKADVVLFVKPGCGHCARAELTTAALPSRHIVPLASAGDRAALARALALPAITVPVCFVHGRCVGDGERLASLLADEAAFAAALARSVPPKPFASGVPDTRAWTERRLCKAPGGSGPAAYFLNTYGNTVRALSCVHVAFFAVVLFGWLPLGAVRALCWPLLVDLALFCLSANASPLALACTAAVWTRRGPVVPAIPYKVVFIFYIISVVRIIAGASSYTEVKGKGMLEGCLVER